MTTGKADQLAIVADAVTCVKCRVNPRFGSLQRCKPCLKADSAVERAARERLLPAQAAPRCNRGQAAASSSDTKRKARKAKAAAPASAARTGPKIAVSGTGALAGKALVPVRPAQPVPTKQTRQQ